MLSDAARSEIQAIQAKYPKPQSAILPALYVAQTEIGWLPNEVLDEVAELFNLEAMEVYAIAGFYNMFYKWPKGKFHLEICTNVPCMLRGANELAEHLKRRLGVEFGETTVDGNFTLDHMECLGSCATAPMVFARRSQSDWGRYYENLTVEQADAMIDELLAFAAEDAPAPPMERTPAGPYHHDHHPETNFLLARIDKADSHTIESYLADGGYETARKVTKMIPADVVREVTESGLRGRGGAGFPTGMKWGFVPKTLFPRYLVVNADESEPGTFKDRLIIEYDPHQLLEGIICASWAIQANYAFIYIRGEYMFGAERLNAAIAEAKEKGYLGKGIFGTDFDLEVIVHRGAGAYICGEETALLSSLEGGRGHPRLKPPFPAVAGLYAKPTIVNNVETISQVGHILAHGAEWYRQWGTESSPGFQLVCLSGQVKKPGVYEIPYGTSFRTLIYDMAGGTVDDRPIKSIIPGGLSMPHLLPTSVDAGIDFESCVQAGSLLGSGGIMVVCEGESIVAVARRTLGFYREESCGKCTPCREGTGWMEKVLKRIERGEGTMADLDNMQRITKYVEQQSFCPFGPAAVWGLQSTLRLFRPEFEAHIQETNPDSHKPDLPVRPIYRPYVGEPVINLLED
ncbi:MAG: NADH-quinone oxidoreductase subunit NuoF [Caldilineales bacterium]|nr:NADH-quinone oxidoreductase subunit NuoF [Caldilineales bacterium]